MKFYLFAVVVGVGYDLTAFLRQAALLLGFCDFYFSSLASLPKLQVLAGVETCVLTYNHMQIVVVTAVRLTILITSTRMRSGVITL